MEDKQLDHIVRNKLQNLRPDLPADAWERFEQTMDAHLSDQNLSEENLDQIIHEKLQGLTPVLPVDAWDQFEHVLDAVDSGVPEQDPSLIDEMAFAKMRGLEVNSLSL